MRYKFFEHTADVKFQSYGKTLEESFQNAALALKEVIMKGKQKVNEKIEKKIIIKEKDNVALLQKFLEEFLFWLDAEDFIFSKVKVEISNYKLIGEVYGDKASSYKFTNDVKAVTYNQMKVWKEKDKFICQAVLDV
jgi:SHS2 domain-containing protein